MLPSLRCKVGENKGAAGVKGFGLLGATPRKKLRDDIASGSVEHPCRPVGVPVGWLD